MSEWATNSEVHVEATRHPCTTQQRDSPAALTIEGPFTLLPSIPDRESAPLYKKIPKNLLNEREGKAQFKGLNRLC